MLNVLPNVALTHLELYYSNNASGAGQPPLLPSCLPLSNPFGLLACTGALTPCMVLPQYMGCSPDATQSNQFAQLLRLPICASSTGVLSEAQRASPTPPLSGATSLYG